MIKKTYIPGKPRNPKLSTATGTSGVGKTEFNQVAGSSHEHYNKGVLDQITEAMLVAALRDLITSTDTESELTDENMLSSLRVLSEIAKNNESFLEDLKQRFLSKINPDTAQKLITFTEGVEVGTFTTGALGSGAALKMIDGTSYAEVDNLTVRQKATFRELIIESLKHIGGQLVLSPARMKCNKVVDGGTYYKCYFDTGDGEVSNEFVEGDLARCQVFTGNGTKFYWRLVTLVGEDWINLSKTSAAVGSDAPEAGDDIVQLGNATDTTRQSAIILSTIGDDAPSWKQYSGINSFSLEGKETTVFSKLGNKIEGKTVFTSGGTNLDDHLDGVAQDILDALKAAQDAEDKAQQAIDDAEANVGLINTEIGKLQAQLDGEVSNWFYAYSPTLANYPASDWTTNEIKDRHIGDTFTNTAQAPATDAGKSWRFVKNGSVYSWTLIADSDAVKALLEASKAQATADGKSTTHLFQPTKYKLGDMWVLNADQTVNGTAYKQGDILTAIQDSETFNQTHWLKRVRYTDDTAVNDLEIGGRNFILHSLIHRGTYGDDNRGRWYNNSGGVYDVTKRGVFKENTQYTLWYERGDIDSGNMRPQVYYTDGSISRDIWASDIPFITPKNKTVDYVRFTYGLEGRLEIINPTFVEGNKPLKSWTPAPEDVQAEIDDVSTGLTNLGAEINTAFSNLSITNIEANNLDLLRKSLAKEVADVRAIAVSMGVSVVDLDSKISALNTEVNKYTGKADSVYPITVTVANRTAVDTAFSNLEASIVALYEAIDDKRVDNIEIGGRNLIRDSNWVISEGSKKLNYSGLFLKEDNVEAIISFDYNVVNAIKTHSLYHRIGFEGDYRNGGRLLSGWIYLEEGKSVSGRASFKVILKRDSFTYLNAFVQTGGDIVELGNFKLEKGNKATDWTPAPEDVQAEIDAAKQEALDAASDAQSTADSLKDFTDTAFRDGIIDRSESVAIEKYKNTLNETMSKAEASYMKVFLNTYLEGAAKTDLEQAKINLWGQRDTLLSAINTAISGGTTTPAQKTAVDNAFSTFNNLMTAFQNALEEANKAIQTKLDDLSTEKVNNIQIGGRNLFSVNDFVADNKARGYSTINVINYNGNIAYRSSNIVNNHNIPRYLQGKFEANTQYYLQFKINWESYTNSGAQYIFQIRYTDGTISNLYATTSQTYRAVLTAANKTIDYITTTRQHDGTVVIYEIQIEKANKPSDWTPAPEDVEAAIDETKLTAEQAQLAADGYMRARYVRDWAGRNTANNYSLWYEVKVFNKAGINVAQGKSVEGKRPAGSSPYSNITDGNTTTYGQPTGVVPEGETDWVKIDLGQIYYDIDYIQVWHHSSDSRTYYGTKTEISEDGVNWTTIFDSAVEGTYVETAEGKIHTQRYASVMNRIAETEAKTRFQTLIDGGLIYTALMKLFDTISGDETAFISGKQGAGKNLPAFGAGGSYQDALAGLAKIIFRHDGTGKIGVFEVDEIGSVKIYDPDIADLLRLEFVKSKVPTVASLLSQTQEGQSVTNVAKMFISSGSAVLPNSINVTEDSAELSFSGTMELDVTFDELDGATFGSAYVGVALYKDGFNYAALGGISSGQLSNSNYSFSNSVQINKKLTVPKGVYTIVVSGSFNNALGAAGINNTSTLSWILRKDIRRFIFGSDGFASWYTENSFHFSELTGMFARGKVDIPAGLGGGSSSAGGTSGRWGMVTGATRSSSTTTITHSVGDLKYTVMVTPSGSSATWYMQNKTVNSVQIISSGAFDYILVRTPN